MTRHLVKVLAPLLGLVLLSACQEVDPPAPSVPASHRHEVVLSSWGVRTTYADGDESPVVQAAPEGFCENQPSDRNLRAREAIFWGPNRVVRTRIHAVPEGCLTRAAIGHNPPYLHSPDQASKQETRREYHVPGGRAVEVVHEDSVCTNACEDFDVTYVFVTWTQHKPGTPATLVLMSPVNSVNQPEMRRVLADLRQL